MNQFTNPYLNPYLAQPQNMNFQQNMLPPQQILQANGKASVDAIRLSPNSSVLIADSTRPIIWKCISDSLGNTTSEAFDVSPHKDEEEIKQDAFNSDLRNIEHRLERLEREYESIIRRSQSESDNAEHFSDEKDHSDDEKFKQSQRNGQSDAP